MAIKKKIGFEKKSKVSAKGPAAQKTTAVAREPAMTIAAPVEEQKSVERTMFTSAAPKEAPKLVGEETKQFEFTEKERLITTLTAGGVVMSFGLSFGGVLIAPASPGMGGLLATLGIVSCMGAFMARETI